MYLLRLDDACEYMDVDRWSKIENILDKHEIKPIVGIIPCCEDPLFIETYSRYRLFWEKAREWQSKGWTIALHGYNHVYSTKSGGINPVNKKSEFAGVPFEEQKLKVLKGFEHLKSKKLIPTVFFAPSHTFDKNTLIALKQNTDIRVISDTIANNIYFKDDFFFIPQQSGKVRSLKFRTTTFCLHPNFMNEVAFTELDEFIAKNKVKFIRFDEIKFNKRPLTMYDYLLRKIYFLKRALKR